MKERLELYIYSEYLPLIYGDKGEFNLDETVTKVSFETNDHILEKVREVYNTLYQKKKFLFLTWKYQRNYSQKEIDNANFFQLIRTRHFEPTAEECGTLYDDAIACPLCHANARQLTPLLLKKSSIPNSDIAETIAWGNETIVSEKFVELANKNKLKGLIFNPVYTRRGEKISQYYQLLPEHFFDFSERTDFGYNPFKYYEKEEGHFTTRYDDSGCPQEVYIPPVYFKCPDGHNAGFSLLSEAFIRNSSDLEGLDFFASKQTVGARSGLIRPHHILFCSNRMMRIIKENKLKGFKFEVAHVVDE